MMRSPQRFGIILGYLVLSLGMLVARPVFAQVGCNDLNGALCQKGTTGACTCSGTGNGLVSCTAAGTECTAPITSGATPVNPNQKLEDIPASVAKDCQWDTNQKGVLISHPIVVADPPDQTKPGYFQCYLRVLLSESSILIVAIAVILVVFSGVQYIFAFGNTANQTKAKERIVSIVTGVIFWTLINFILRITGIF